MFNLFYGGAFYYICRCNKKHRHRINYYNSMIVQFAAKKRKNKFELKYLKYLNTFNIILNTQIGTTIFACNTP